MDPDELVSRFLSGLRKEYRLLSNQHTKHWSAFLAIGLAVGAVASVFWITNQSGKLQGIKAASICGDKYTYEITSPNSIYEPRTRKPTSYIIPGGSIQLGLKNLTTGVVEYGGSYNFVSSKPDKVAIKANIATDVVKKYDDYDMFIDVSVPDLLACKNVIQPMRVMIGNPFLGKNIAFIYPKSLVPAKIFPSGAATISVDQMMTSFDFVRITDLAYALEKKLFGIVPFVNDVVLFGLMPPWCGGGGQPTGIGLACLIQPNGEPQWGVVYHEMGHDFTGHFLLEFIDGVGSQYPSRRNIFVNWADCCNYTIQEGIATLAWLYSGYNLTTNAGAYGISGSILTSIKNKFSTDVSGYTNDLKAYEVAGNKFSSINANVLDGMFIYLAQTYGWEIYPKAFKIYLDPLPSFVTGPLSATQGHTYFIAGLSAASGYDLRYKFKKWGFPVDDNYYNAIYPALEAKVYSGITLPTPPGNLVADDVLLGNLVNLAWNPSMDNKGVTGYRLERCGGSSTCTDFAEIASLSGSATFYSDSSVVVKRTYRYRVRAINAAGNLSAYSNIVNATPTGTATTKPNDAMLVSHTVPDTIAAGATATVSITVKNTGTATWTAGTNYRVGSQNSPATRWGTATRIYLADQDSIAPGQTKTFIFNIKAPVTPDSYAFKWRMVQEKIEWFGSFAPDKTITVTGGG